MERSGCTGWGLAIVLTLIFLVLQVTGVICWTWFWILSPLIFMLIADITISLIMVIIWIYFNK